MFAQLAFEFGEVVGVSESSSFFLDFAGNPLPQTSEMDFCTAALAFARRNKRIIFGLLIAAAYFTIDFTFTTLLYQLAWLDFIHSIALMVEVGFPDSFDFVVGFHFDDNVFHPPKLDDRSWLQRVALTSTAFRVVLSIDFVEIMRIVFFLFYF